MGIIAWVVLGLLAGLIAKFIMPGRDPGGLFITILIGIVGALLGGFIATQIGIGGIGNFWAVSTWLTAIGGSLILLIIYRMVR